MPRSKDSQLKSSYSYFQLIDYRIRTYSNDKDHGLKPKTTSTEALTLTYFKGNTGELEIKASASEEKGM